jgi:hypothetical protein
LTETGCSFECVSIKLKAAADADHTTLSALCYCHLPFILSALLRLSIAVGCTALRGAEGFLEGDV